MDLCQNVGYWPVQATLPERLVLNCEVVTWNVLSTISRSIMNNLARADLYSHFMAGQRITDIWSRISSHSSSSEMAGNAFTRICQEREGRQDSAVGYVDAWHVLENYPRATYAVLDRAGHGLGEEQKGLFRALAGEWLDRVEESSA